MEIKLLTPLNNLPKAIDFNYEEILLEAERSVDKYKGLIYDEKQIVEARSDRAEINAKIKALKALKTDIKKELTRPYDEFSKKMDSIIEVFEKAVVGIDTQVKAVENKNKEEKRTQIISAYTEVFDTYAEYVPIEKLWNDKWLNATYRYSAIVDELKFLKDRIVADIAAISVLKSENETELLAYYFDCLDFSKTLLRFEALKTEKEKISKLQKSQKAEQPKSKNNNAPIDEKTYTFELRITGTKQQLNNLKAFLVNNKLNYEKLN